MNVNRTTIFAALLAAGLASGAIAQSTAPTTPSKSSTAAGSTATPATPAPPSAGSTGMDKGAGTTAGAPAKTTSGAKSSNASSSLAAGERRFLEKAAQAGKAEIEISKLALQKAENPKAKELAQRMIDDHTKAAAELEKLASAKGVTLPTDMDGGHKRLLDKLSKKSGNAFDREYTDEMEDDHSKVVRDFRSMAKSAKDADVKAFAEKTLPTLEQHLQLAKDAESAVKGTARKTTTAGAGSSTMSPAPATTAKSTAAPAKDTTATPAAPAGSTPSSASAPPASGTASDTKSTSPTK
jgi:putative membrane protein